jgi:hypothetical protein
MNQSLPLLGELDLQPACRYASRHVSMQRRHISVKLRRGVPVARRREERVGEDQLLADTAHLHVAEASHVGAAAAAAEEEWKKHSEHA